jgi:CheY-like chemotaxis protein
VLESRGAEVVYAEDGKRGLALIEADPSFDLVITDVMMPEVDGYETMRRIRANPMHASLPILAITAKALQEDREKCLEAGASDYLSKPVQVPELLETIRLWLRR